MLITADGTLQKINRSGLGMLEADSFNQAKGLCIYPRVSEEYRDAFKTLIHDVFKGESRTLECKMIGLKGRPRWLSVHAVPLRNEKGEIDLALATTFDITERKWAEEALERLSKRHKAMLAAVPDIIMEVDKDKVYTWANEAGKRFFGDDAIGKEASFYFEGEQKVYQVVQPLFEGSENVIYLESWQRRRDGEKRLLAWWCRVLKDEEGNVTGALSSARDITDGKQAEQILVETKEMLSLFIQHSPIYTYIKDVTPTKSRVLHASDNFHDMIGISGREMTGKTMQELFPPEFAGKITADDWNVVSGGKVLKLNEELNGRTYSTMKFPLIRGNKTLLAGYTIDITERKEAEEKLIQSESFVRNILDSVDEGFIVIDRDYRVLTANKGFCKQVGGCEKEIIGRHCYEVSHERYRPCYEEGEDCAVRHVFETGDPYTSLHKHKDIKGSILYVETRAVAIKDEKGNVTSAIETVNNITEKFLLEEERLKTQKLESIGTLAGGIAHDFNNLLQGIFGYISMARRTIEQKDKALAMLDQAENALHQSKNLTSQLLTFSKGGKPEKKLIDLLPVIENSTTFILSGSRSDFKMNIPDDLWQAEADEGQLGQVIQNIVLNADQAMPMGGSIIVTATNVAEDDVSLPPGLARGKYVMISIQDVGIGIPNQYLDKIFDPYFTTKEKGSGLGLATSYSIIRNHGGMIDIRTKPGKGSTFMIYLPAIVGQCRTTAAAKMVEPSQMRSARVLVMDDEEIIRTLSIELLSEFGHTVEVAKHGQETLEKYQAAMTAGKPFDIVILDLTIRGGMGGVDTMRKLLEIDPSVKAIVSSGYSEDAAIADYLSHGFKAVLKKPFDIAQLSDILISLLS